MKVTGLNVSEYFSDGNKPALLYNKSSQSQWSSQTLTFENKVKTYRFPCGQRQMHQNSQAIHGSGRIRVSSPLNYIDEFIELCKINKAKVCYVLNINDELQYGDNNFENHMIAISKIIDTGLKIELVEYGNELYMNPQITGGTLGLTFKSGLLYNLLVKPGIKNVVERYFQRATIYYNTIKSLSSETKFAPCIAEDMNNLFKDWNTEVFRRFNQISDGYAIHIYPDRWKLGQVASNLRQHFSNTASFARAQGKEIYVTEIALQNHDKGLSYLTGYDIKSFWESFDRELQKQISPKEVIIWRLGGANTNSYNFYTT